MTFVSIELNGITPTAKQREAVDTMLNSYLIYAEHCRRPAILEYTRHGTGFKVKLYDKDSGEILKYARVGPQAGLSPGASKQWT